MRATFANLRLRNKITPDKRGKYYHQISEQKEMRIFEAAMEYKKQGITLAVFAGDNYVVAPQETQQQKVLCYLE